MSEIDDAEDFIDIVVEEKRQTEIDKAVKSSRPSLTIEEIFNGGKAKETVVPGTPSQYAAVGGGYLPTTPTVATLPPGNYNLVQTETGIIAVQAPNPTGLLLELPEMRSADVIKAVETFWASEKDYKEGNEFVTGGAAYKAGIMIYGPPGSGKTCTMKIVSNKLIALGGTVFYADLHPRAIMNFLEQFSQIEKNRKSIVILEDIDSLIDGYGEVSYLSMLDSAKSIDNVLFMATTNYPERLDPRIYNRPGRFSHVIKIGAPTPAAREAYLRAVLKNHKDVEYIVENSNNFTIDHLSALINAVYREKKDLTNEIQRLKTLFKIPKVVNDQIGIRSTDE